jgi:HEAT repeat protein
MLATLLLALAPLAAPLQEKTPAPEEVAATCASLAKALEKNASVEDAVGALRAAVAVVDARVIDVIDAKGLRHAEPAVRDAAVDALGHMDHPDALSALHDALKRDKKALLDAPTRYAALLRAIARHGKESSIPDLVDGAFESSDKKLVTARILGLAHVRSPKSVEELMRLVRSSHRSWEGSQMSDFRLALAVLTGADEGTERQAWIHWYGDHKGKIVVTPQLPELPPELLKRWNSYWDEADEPAQGQDHDPK